MKKSTLILGCILLFCLPTLKSQNQNVTFRARISYPSETLANVWGYAANDREYALVGAAKGLSIVDITNPDAPQQIVQIPGPNNLWKEVKTYQHYAYVVSEGGSGVQIVDLSNLPNANLPFKFYKGDGTINNQLNRSHALHIDTAKGFLYVYGATGLFSGAPLAFNLSPDPWNPQYVGVFADLGYVHDGYVDNDTLFAGHIYAGQFSIVDMSDKSNPKLLGTQTTPGQFTHNTWLTNDRRTLLTTDEVNDSWLAAYDVSNPDDIKLLDRIKSNPGSNSIVHNTHILHDFAITSWYKDGLTIVDIADPANLVQVGNYDTYPGTGSGFDGCWGVYPYFPSGTIVATNINAQGSNNGELFVLTPKYVRAGRLQGKITNAATDLPLSAVKIEILNTNPTLSENTPVSGLYKMGIGEPARHTVRYSKIGFQTIEREIFFQSGQTVQLDIALYPNQNYTVNGNVFSGKSNSPLSNATVNLTNTEGQAFQTQTNANGYFEMKNIPAGMYEVIATSISGSSAILYEQKIVADKNLQMSILPLPIRPMFKIREQD